MAAASLSPQDWEALIEDYNRNGAPNDGAAAEQALASLLRKDLPHHLKIHLLIFLEQHSLSLFASPNSSSLTRLLEALRHLIQSPNPSDLKEQFLISATSVFIAVPDPDLQALEGLVELLLTVVNRPNHGVDRQTRAVACECLRELEIAHPCLLSEAVAHIWSLCQTERTHASQSYVLLLATVLYNIVHCRPSLSNLTILSASAPLVPFNVPRFVLDGEDGVCDTSLLEAGLHKELRRAISFLLEWPQYFTPLGTMEFMRMTIPMAKALELQPSLLKVQFSGLVYTYDPLLSHAYLGIYLEFLDSFDGEELEIADRLVLQTKESSQNAVFRLLALHWLLGLIRLVVHRDASKKKSVVDRSLSFYPAIFDSLALKSLKLDLVAYCAVLLNDDKKNTNGAVMDAASEAFLSKLLIDGLTCVSSFKWLPPWSTETLVAFRTFHKFLVGASFTNESDPPSNNYIIQSSIFHTLQGVLVESILNYEGLVLLIVSFVDRFLECSKHYWLGEQLLETLNDSFLPKLKIDYTLGSYFPILERIAENNKVPPSGLIELLSNFILFLIEKHGPETGLKSWSLGSKLLGICRTMLIHHHSSSLFIGLSHLLAFTCLSFPDLEVRDHARTYLRMLVCIPGKKLRNLLNMGEELPGIAPSTHSSSFLNHQLPLYHDLKKSEGISSYIHLERSVPLLVRQSWSLTLPDLSFVSEVPLLPRNVVVNEITSEPDGDDGDGASSGVFSDVKRIGHLQEPLRVMDTKDSAIVEILRKHFSSIPDLRYSRGFKVKIPCSLSFDSELFNQSADTSQSSEVDSLLAIYATVLKFSSSAPYGSIPSYHVPFLLGQPNKEDYSFSQTDSLEIVAIGNGCVEGERSRADVIVELEPRVPQPGLVDVWIQSNANNGQIVEGQLHSLNVGIEDMFMKAIVPKDVPEVAVANYYLDLFNALWEACGASSSTGREAFVLKDGKGAAAINGTESVKLLEAPYMAVIQAVERCLTPFIVSVIGEPLTRIFRNGETMRDVVWKDFDIDVASEVSHPDSRLDKGPLYIEYTEGTDKETDLQTVRKNMGTFLILIFLPPRFHLLFKMEVCEVSTLARVRTDYWPCLAYVDELLESLFDG